MSSLYEKVMALDDSEVERIEREEAELIEKLGAVKLHDFDNVAEGKNGELYALEKLGVGDDIVKCGELFAKAKSSVEPGEIIKI